jgi:hypothetical protein
VLTDVLSIEMSAPVLASKWLDVSNTLVIRYGHEAVAVVLLKLRRIQRPRKLRCFSTCSPPPSSLRQPCHCYRLHIQGGSR